MEIHLYFLRNMYAEFVLGKHVNCFVILQFQGTGGGIPPNLTNSRLRDLDLPICAPRKQFPGLDVPPVHRVSPHTCDAYLSLARVVVFHSTMVQHMGVKGHMSQLWYIHEVDMVQDHLLV